MEAGFAGRECSRRGSFAFRARRRYRSGQGIERLADEILGLLKGLTHYASARSPQFLLARLHLTSQIVQRGRAERVLSIREQLALLFLDVVLDVLGEHLELCVILVGPRGHLL